MTARFVRWAAVAAVLVGIGCSERSERVTSRDTGSVETLAQASSVELLPNENAAILLPSGHSFDHVAVSAAEGITFDAHASALSAAGSTKGITFNAGTSGTALATWSRVEAVLSVGPVALKNRARVEGDVTSGGAIAKAAGATIVGAAMPHQTVAVRRVVMPLKVTPGTDAFVVAPGGSMDLQPGRYAALSTKPFSTAYELDTLELHAKASLVVDTSNGPVIVLVKRRLDLSGEVTTSGPSGSFMIGVTGVEPARIGGAFHGSVFAPYAQISLRAHQHGAGIVGQFFAKSVRVEEHTASRFGTGRGCSVFARS